MSTSLDSSVSRLLLYGDLDRDGVVSQLAALYRDWNSGSCTLDQTVVQYRALAQARRLLEMALQYGLDGDLWTACLTLLLISAENPFALASERSRAGAGTLRQLALEDMAVFQELFRFPLEELDGLLSGTPFTRLRHFQAAAGETPSPAGQRILALRDALTAAETPSDFLERLCAFYRQWGTGVFALSSAFRPQPDSRNAIVLQPTDTSRVASLSDLIGYERQKAALRENTLAFLQERPANNVLLYGDAGTGKSTCVKALLREYQSEGLRMVELYKHQFELLPALMASLRSRNYRFILLIDDLSFEESEVSYKYLKAAIEGGVESCPENVLIYATSNRRHLIREIWGDRADMEYREDMHRSDTMQEKLSLAARFGVSINFDCPSRQEYHDIVRGLAARHPEITLPESELLLQSDQWELRHGGVSGRTAQQFISYLAGMAVPAASARQTVS